MDEFSTLIGLPAAFLVGLGIVLVQLVQRASGRSLTWGALWGTAAGIWFVAPKLIRAHHLYPETIAAWLLLVTALLAAFAVLGAALGFTLSAAVTAVAAARRKPFRRPDLAYALGCAVLLPPGYLTMSWLVARLDFPHPPPVREFAAAMFPIAPAYAGICLGLIALYWRRGNNARVDTSLRVGVMLLTLTGCVVLPWRAGHRPKIEAQPITLVRQSREPRRPLFILGLDGGNWRALDPLLKTGRLPNFQKLIQQGRHGDIEALWPPYWSTPAWAAILTGHTQEDVGVYEDLSAEAPGLPAFELPLVLDPALNPMFIFEYLSMKAGVIRPMPTPRSSLRQPPVWEILTKAGVKTAVVRFAFTYPAAGQATIVVSNRIVTDLWGMMQVVPGKRSELAAPVEESERLLDWFSPERTPSDQVLRQILPRVDWPRPADAKLRPIEVIGPMLDESQRMLNVTEDIIERHPDLDVVMLHVPAFDNLSHAFWQYRFPEDFADNPPAPADVEQLGPIIDRYLEFLDRRLGEVIGRFREVPNVIVVSDHGEERNTANAMWKAWHSRYGMFIESGPDVDPDDRRLAVSYFDIVPTILDFEGFGKPAELSGRSRLARPPLSPDSDDRQPEDPRSPTPLPPSRSR
jgi:predicted AlkP superfamily phosphohydrolase/phosphomutase